METMRAGEGCKTVTVELDKSKTVDTLTLIDMRFKVLKLVRRSKELAIEFCDRCAEVCDASCPVAAIREHALIQALRLEARF
jgi:Fe-S-cluster-containing hydrogenase component 2